MLCGSPAVEAVLALSSTHCRPGRPWGAFLSGGDARPSSPTSTEDHSRATAARVHQAQRTQPLAARTVSLPGQQLEIWTRAPPGKGQRQQELRPPPQGGVCWCHHRTDAEKPPRDKQGPHGSMGHVPPTAVPVTQPWMPVLRPQP